MNFVYNSLLPQHKTPFGVIKQDSTCTINLHFYDINARSAKLIIEHENANPYKILPMTKRDENCFSVSFSESNCGLYYYYFLIDDKISVYKDDYFSATINGNNKWQLTCFDKNYTISDDFKGKVYYQIFPDRFYKHGHTDTTLKLKPFTIHNDINEIPVFAPNEKGIIENNDFFGGNLKGITKKLFYIKSLGVSVIYLNPIFKAYSNHRYDTADYLKIDELLGTENDFKTLCDTAHNLGIKIVLDGVFSHTGCNSIYFDKYKIFSNGAYQNKNSPYFNWYKFKQNSDTEYESWWGIDTLPCTNETEQSFMDFIINTVVPYWLNLGADGFRLDVADELPDIFIKKLNEKVKSLKKDSIVIGEVWEDASYKISYSERRKYFTNTELDSVMNYPYRDLIIKLVTEKISTKNFLYGVITISEHYPKEILDCVLNSLSTHDTMRILTALSDINFCMTKEEKSKFLIPDDKFKISLNKLKLAVCLQFLLCGCACIYYGDEIGMQGFEDPLNREFFKWHNINYDILNFYKDMSTIKNNIKAFAVGTFSFDEYDDYSFSFYRILDNQTYQCTVSLLDNCKFKINGKIIYSHNTKIEKNTAIISKYGFIIIKKS